MSYPLLVLDQHCIHVRHGHIILILKYLNQVISAIVHFQVETYECNFLNPYIKIHSTQNMLLILPSRPSKEVS